MIVYRVYIYMYMYIQCGTCCHCLVSLHVHTMCVGHMRRCHFVLVANALAVRIKAFIHACG